ncbi:MAG: cupin domain-containing protein [Desulfovibrio sp.]|jgi:quercetin dioxygenase-like cupin family protein|nr:cupin domain-containing protein [Desulfovibrio sp.]
MKVFIVMMFLLPAAMNCYEGQAIASERKQSQTITKAGTQPSVRGSDKFFTGNVRIEPLFSAKGTDAPFGGAYVTFEPGARTFWHTHPTGQQLLVVSGVGRTGDQTGTLEEVRVGDVLWCPPGVKHWHGAAPATAMTHLALTGTLPDGKNVEWMEPVTDEQYNGKR